MSSTKQAMSSTSPVRQMRERDEDGATPPTSHAPSDSEFNESEVEEAVESLQEMVLGAPPPAAGTWSSAPDDETDLLEFLPEEWRAFGVEFHFSFSNIVCLMSTVPGQSRDDTTLTIMLTMLASELESALEDKNWNRTQTLLCVLVRSDLVFSVDAMLIHRLAALAGRAARASESDYQAEFTSRLGKALAEPLATFIKLLSALDSSSPTEGCGGGGDGGAGAAIQCGGGHASGLGGRLPAEDRARSSGNQGPRLTSPAGVQKRSFGNRKLRAAMECS